MGTCQRCGAELQPEARFCVMCGAKVVAAAPPTAATTTLTASGLLVAVCVAALCAAVAGGLFVLIRSLL